MNEEVMILAKKRLGPALKYLDFLVFPEDPIKKFSLVEIGGSEGGVKYIPSYKLAKASSVPELQKTESGEESYAIFLPNLADQVKKWLTIYYLYYKLYRQENIEVRAYEAILVGMAAHEVRHRIQLHFNPSLFRKESGKKDDVIQLAILLFDDKCLPSTMSEKSRELEFDATVIQIIVTNNFLFNPEPEKITDSDLAKILMTGLGKSDPLTNLRSG